MEYLMTYGWAILIVIIVAAALYSLGVFNPATWTGSRATGFQNIGAPATGAWKLGEALPDNFQVNLRNNLPSRINITAVAVTVGATSCTTTSGTGIAGLGSSISIKANCTGQTQDSSYTASVSITYDNLDTGLTNFRESGTVTGTVTA
jgi:hypothetical protein